MVPPPMQQPICYGNYTGEISFLFFIGSCWIEVHFSIGELFIALGIWDRFSLCLEMWRGYCNLWALSSWVVNHEKPLFITWGTVAWLIPTSLQMFDEDNETHWAFLVERATVRIQGVQRIKVNSPINLRYYLSSYNTKMYPSHGR